ncbi:MAG: hypothetical protein H6502_05460 [Candidatus Woesearchaeota archaeon]|nr:MAG: hypothetical protein H6502_05460 [Candidatus Woesearchaeota archaeon]
MKELILSPNQLVVAGRGDGADVDQIEAYCTDLSQGKSLPPAIVVANDPEQMFHGETFQRHAASLETSLQGVSHAQTRFANEYVLVDGAPPLNIQGVGLATTREMSRLYFMRKFGVHDMIWDNFSRAWNDQQFSPFYLPQAVVNSEDYKRHKDIIDAVAFTCLSQEGMDAELARFDQLRERVTHAHERLVAQSKEQFASLHAAHQATLTRDQSYLLIDGHHKSIARVLAATPVSALMLESADDVAYFKELLETGELTPMYVDANTVPELQQRFYEHQFQLSEPVTTLAETVDHLVSEGFLPPGLCAAYQSKSGA